MQSVRHELIIDLFLQQVASSSPSHPAIILENNEQVSYTELHEISLHIAQSLHSLVFIDTIKDSFDDGDSSSSPPNLVAIMCDRHIGLIASILAVLLTGCTYVPVDPSFPPDRQTYIFQHSQCSVLITDELSIAKAKSLGIQLPSKIILISSHGLLLSPLPSSSSSSSAVIPLSSLPIALSKLRKSTSSRPNGGLIYVLYTSGSTGQPKGVCVTQHGVTNIITFFKDTLSINSSSVVLGLSTICFDISMLEVFLPLISGATLILTFSSTQKNPFRLADILNDYRVTAMQATPTTYEMLLAAGWKGNRQSLDCIVGGEAFRTSLLPLQGLCRRLVNAYGPTETSIWSSIFLFPPPSSSSSFPEGIPIGTPISNTIFYILPLMSSLTTSSSDQTTKEANEGAGELLIGGIGLAEGYLHDEAQTNSKFIPNPFGEGIVYRTGDIVKRIVSRSNRKEINYTFLRRCDDQVKIDGYRIELGEIESVYQRHALVKSVVALVRNNKLVCYVIPSKTKENHDGSGSIDSLTAAEVEELKVYAGLSLPKYMIPTFTISLSSFPMTPNQKIDKKALPDPSFLSSPSSITPSSSSASSSSSSSSSAPVLLTTSKAGGPPRTMVEHICQVMYDIRGTYPSPSSTFLSIGVDSLGAAFFIRILSDSLSGHRINPLQLFQAGVTISSFSVSLFREIEAENPAVLSKLGLSAAAPDDDKDEESRIGSLKEHHKVEIDEENEVDEEEKKDDLKYEAAFHSVLTSNARLLQGAAVYTVAIKTFKAFSFFRCTRHPHACCSLRALSFLPSRAYRFNRLGYLFICHHWWSRDGFPVSPAHTKKQRIGV